MKAITVQVAQLQKGDKIIGTTLTVEAVQSLGSVFIVDFTDNTATAPMPNGLVNIQR